MKDLKDNEIKILRKYSSWRLLESGKVFNYTGIVCSLMLGIPFLLSSFYSFYNSTKTATVISIIITCISIISLCYFLYNLNMKNKLQKKIIDKYSFLTYQHTTDSLLIFFLRKEIENCMSIIKTSSYEGLEKKLMVEYTYLQIQEFIQKSGLYMVLKDYGIGENNTEYLYISKKLNTIKAFLEDK